MKNKFWYFFTTLRSIFALFLSRKLLIVTIFTQTPSTKTLKMNYMTLNLGHKLKYDSETQTNFFFYFLHHFHKNPIFTSFSDPPNNRIWSTNIFSTYAIWKCALLCTTKWKKIKIDFLDSLAGFLTLGHINFVYDVAAGSLHDSTTVPFGLGTIFPTLTSSDLVRHSLLWLPKVEHTPHTSRPLHDLD